MRRLLPLLLTGLSGAAVAGVAGMAMLEPGSWAISRSATGANPVQLCVHDFAALAQWEHRGLACGHTQLSQTAAGSVIAYTCPGGDFGQSKITALTPRSLRVETQGIHHGEPFNYVLFARKTSNCQNR